MRAYRADDADAYFRAVRESVLELRPWHGWAHRRYGPADSVRWVGSRRDAWLLGIEYSFLICRARSGLVAGAIGINRIDWTRRVGNVTFWTRSSATNRGAATRAVRLIADFATRQLHLGELLIVTDAANAASRRVAEKSGARRIATVSGASVGLERHRRAVVYSIALAPDSSWKRT